MVMMLVMVMVVCDLLFRFVSGSDARNDAYFRIPRARFTRLKFRKKGLIVHKHPFAHMIFINVFFRGIFNKHSSLQKLIFQQLR